jgi:hypothetical protein
MEIVSSAGNTSVTIRGSITEKEASALKYLWVTDSVGAFDIIEVQSVTAAGGNLILILAANSLADISTIRQAIAVRLSEDSIEESWLTNTISTISFSVQELQGVY